jgi:hypothetical protein
MMVSDWIAIWRGFLSTSLGFQAFAIFVLVAIAVIAYRIASDMRGPLVLGGVFTATFVLAAVAIEKGNEPMLSGVISMALVGVGRAAYQRLLTA